MTNIENNLYATSRSNGLLPNEVYLALAEFGAEKMNGEFHEIGTAHVEATIAIVLGAIYASGKQLIHTVDAFGGLYSSRSNYGDSTSNYEILISNIQGAGLAQYILPFI